MTLPLTLFTTCKAFDGEFETIQRNALSSWRAACPGSEVLVFGDEKGVSECCRELGLRHIPNVKRTPLGTPLLDDLFAQAERLGSNQLLAFINADIMIGKGLLSATALAQARFEKFLLIARRWNVAIGNPWDFTSSEWETKLARHARAHGSLEAPYGGIDLFLYRRGFWPKLPPFAVGRTRWDSALICNARKMKVPVIDATDSVTLVHQNHGYSHIPENAAGVFKGPEAVRNEQLLGGDAFIFTALNATHVIKNSRIRRNRIFYPPYLIRNLATGPALHPSLRFLIPFVHGLAPSWRRLRQLGLKSSLQSVARPSRRAKLK
jgi:hypothetical protein